MAMGGQEIKFFSQAKLGRRWRRPARGFRLSPTRLSVRRLRARLWTMLGLLGRYFRSVRLPQLTRGLVSSSSSPASTSAGGGNKKGQLPAASQPAGGNGAKPRRPPCMRSNSFYARAVADCLDFIKGSNAAPVEDSRGAAAGAVRHGHGQQHQLLKPT
ncbi:hypothetical protein ZWY2020_048926 [Hordeum vulgare]|nr:hypothetical protein ZWY2020_048926 [Hordeum vulgare]